MGGVGVGDGDFTGHAPGWGRGLYWACANKGPAQLASSLINVFVQR